MFHFDIFLPEEALSDINLVVYWNSSFTLMKYVFFNFSIMKLHISIFIKSFKKFSYLFLLYLFKSAFWSKFMIFSSFWYIISKCSIAFHFFRLNQLFEVKFSKLLLEQIGLIFSLIHQNNFLSHYFWKYLQINQIFQLKIAYYNYNEAFDLIL